MSTPQPDHDSYNIHGKRIMGEKHRLLKRQLGKYLSQEHIDNTPGLADFINSIDESYKNFDKDNKLNGHAFRIAEMEYQEITKKLNSEKETIERGVKRLTNMIRAISPNFDINKISEKDDLLFIADCLEEQVSKRKQVERQLKIAVEREKQASNVKSEFLATISHEIRSPLNVITSLSHILLGEDYLPHQKENLEVLKIASNNLLLLINDVLDFSKIESGMLELKKYSFDLHSFLKDLRKSSLPLAEEKNLSFHLNISSELPRVVNSDSLRIKQIIVNLISNAIKFTENGSITLNALLRETKENGYLIRFEVIDTGIGIPADKLQRVFDQFYQLKSNKSRNGTGLGLTITKHLLGILSSKIEVESEVGLGTKFYFELFLEKGDTDDIEEVSSFEPYVFENFSILVADDMAFNRLVIEKILKKWNLKIDFAENGKEAFEKACAKDYDLILMDVHMPVLNGIESSKKIKAVKSEACVIALTASSDDKTKQSVFEAGMDDFVTKPIIPNELYKIIKNQLSKARVSR